MRNVYYYDTDREKVKLSKQSILKMLNYNI